MKNRTKASLYALLLAGLLILLSACGSQEADIEMAILAHSSEGFTRVSLQAGSTKAAVSGNLEGKMRYGECFSLSAAPFFQDEVFYFPLEDVIPLMGGTCQVEGDSAQVRLYDIDMTFRVGSPEVLADGTLCLGYPQEDRSPQIVDGVFYLPQGLELPGLEGPLGRVYPEQDVVILTRTFSAFHCELCAAGVWMEEPFEEVPASVRRTLKSVGTEYPETAQCNAERYNGDGISIWVDRPVEGEEPDETATGYVVCIQLTGDKYQTWRGLRVGDSRERAELLYGDLGPDSELFTAFPFEVTFDETDHVSKIAINSYMFDADASVLK